ncbi:MAG: serine--tRNA ligase [Planctomycetota bacterium]
MLDIRMIRENPDLIREGARKKRIECDVDRILELDVERRELMQKAEELKALRNTRSKEVPKLQGEEKQAAIQEMGEVSARIKSFDVELREIEEKLEAEMLRVPNPPAPEVPEGADDTENVELRTWGEVPSFDFEPLDHIALGEKHDIIDVARGAQMAGSRNYILKGMGTLLDQAILRLAFDHLVSKGFVPMTVPLLVRDQAMVGTGYYPGGEEQAYRCERDGLSLIGTSEVPLTSYHAGEILKVDELPKKYVALSPCFRREAGAHGKDTHGLYRVHQFYKVEQVIVTKADPELSKEHHLEILQNSEEILQKLEIPYRVVNVCGGDLGQGQIQKFDLESWMPSRQSYSETHSASRFHDFQARRLNMRYKDEEGKIHHCFTLNNTVIASPRALIPVLELNQQADGTIRVPEALRPYMGGKEQIG